MQGSIPSFAKVPEVGLRRIVAAIDFSESSRKALQYALSLGKHFKAEVLLLHVFEPVPPGVGIMEGVLVDTSFHEQAAQELEEWRRQVTAEIKTSVVLRDGASPHKQIVAVAKEVEADLIVIGNRGRSGLGGALMGTTAEKVVRSAPCPVLVIREREHDFVSEPE